MRWIVFAILPALVSSAAAAHEGFDFVGPDGHAPIGVMNDHVHRAGEWMLSYRYMRMHMDGNRDGTDRVSEAAVVDPAGYGFTVAPVEMDTDMHMFGVMYALDDTITLMAMASYVENSMDHVTRMGARFTTASSGIGDLNLSGLIRLIDRPARSLHLNLGVALPTGSIDKRDVNPRCEMLGNCPARLPYPMQLGSGTVDPKVGLTWRGTAGVLSWGTQATAIFRLGRNDQGYSQGERYAATAWTAARAGDRLSFSARLAASEWTDYDGRDEDLAVGETGFIPTAETGLRGGRRVDAGIGFNWSAGDGMFAGHRLAVEMLYPVYQNLDGPQLESDGMFVAGWQYARY